MVFQGCSFLVDQSRTFSLSFQGGLLEFSVGKLDLWVGVKYLCAVTNWNPSSLEHMSTVTLLCDRTFLRRCLLISDRDVSSSQTGMSPHPREGTHNRSKFRYHPSPPWWTNELCWSYLTGAEMYSRQLRYQMPPQHGWPLTRLAAQQAQQAGACPFLVSWLFWTSSSQLGWSESSLQLCLFESFLCSSPSFSLRRTLSFYCFLWQEGAWWSLISFRNFLKFRGTILNCLPSCLMLYPRRKMPHKSPLPKGMEPSFMSHCPGLWSVCVMILTSLIQDLIVHTGTKVVI